MHKKRVQPSPSQRKSPKHTEPSLFFPSSDGPYSVNARGLHLRLGVKSKFVDWWRSILRACPLTEHSDYQIPTTAKATTQRRAHYKLTPLAAIATAHGKTRFTVVNSHDLLQAIQGRHAADIIRAELAKGDYSRLYKLQMPNGRPAAVHARATSWFAAGAVGELNHGPLCPTKESFRTNAGRLPSLSQFLATPATNPQTTNHQIDNSHGLYRSHHHRLAPLPRRQLRQSLPGSDILTCKESR